MADFKIEGTDIAEPKTFEIIPETIGKEDRLANGRLVKDVVVVKNTFVLSYPFLKWTDLDNILTLLDTDTFVTLTYPYDGSSSTAEVTAKDIPQKLSHKATASGDWLYLDITLTLQEQ